MQAALATELAKAEPDLAAVAAVGDDVQAKNLALRHQVRDAWLAVYSTFSPDQKAIVRDALRQAHGADATDDGAPSPGRPPRLTGSRPSERGLRAALFFAAADATVAVGTFMQAS